MQPASPGASRYDSWTIIFHWTVAVLVIGQWIGAQLIDYFPRGPLRVDARSLHIVFGALLGLILVARIIWRASGGRRLPPADHGALNILAKATHWGLYLLLVAMIAVGVFLAWVRGDSLFNVVQIPQYSPGNRALRDQVQNLHDTMGWIILALAGIHAAAALVHRYLWKDGVLARMLPQR